MINWDHDIVLNIVFVVGTSGTGFLLVFALLLIALLMWGSGPLGAVGVAARPGPAQDRTYNSVRVFNSAVNIEKRYVFD